MIYKEQLLYRITILFWKDKLISEITEFDRPVIASIVTISNHYVKEKL